MLNFTARRADLAGALFQGCELCGADLSGSKLNGAHFDGVSYSRIGGRYTDALALALSALAAGATGEGPAVSRALAAGLTGDPFAFVYNSADILQSPMTPFTQQPLRAAVQAGGNVVETLYDLSSSKALAALTRAVKAAKPCLLPISLAGGELSGSDLAEPYWAAAVLMDDAQKPPSVVLLVPPFGERTLSQEELARRWEGPFPTLEPTGTERSEAHFPLLILSQGDTPRTPRETVLAALGNALEIINERRTYSTLNPGLNGLKRLAEDFDNASRSTDPQAITALAPWAGAPRKLLISARLEAAEFLQLASGLVLPEERSALTQASALFQSEAKLLSDEFPALRTDSSATTEQLKARCQTAGSVLEEMAGLEATACGLLRELVANAGQ